MTYLLSLLTSESPAQESAAILCYYINKTAGIQNVRVVHGAECYFERLVFARESILFEAPPESCLEVFSQRDSRTRLDRIACKLFEVNEKEENGQAGW